ncbi:MAG: hypothetical protein ACR2RL_17730 [Gammaproteobacteria bacterium]
MNSPSTNDMGSTTITGAPDRADAGASVFGALEGDALEALLLKLRLYADLKVGSRAHRDPGLDPHDLSLRAIEDTLTGKRVFNAGRFELLKHLTNCVDSYISHHRASKPRRRFEAMRADEALAHNQPSAEPTPEQHWSADRATLDLAAYIRRRHPRLVRLFQLVVERGLSLSERRDVAEALGLDPGVSADMQRAYRQINALQAAVRDWQVDSIEDDASRPAGPGPAPFTRPADLDRDGGR